MQPGETFAFTMCNPPFFESADEAGRNPRTAFGGSPQETVTPGGEAAFVRQMVHDSLKLKVLLEGMRRLSLTRALTGPAKRPLLHCPCSPAVVYRTRCPSISALHSSSIYEEAQQVNLTSRRHSGSTGLQSSGLNPEATVPGF